MALSHEAGQREELFSTVGLTGGEEASPAADTPNTPGGYRLPAGQLAIHSFRKGAASVSERYHLSSNQGA